MRSLSAHGTSKEVLLLAAAPRTSDCSEMGCFRWFLSALALVSIAVVLAAGHAAGRRAQDPASYCLARDLDPPSHFNAHTAYEASDSNSSVPDPPDRYPVCEPVFFWHLVRHGTRYPKKGDIKTMRKNLESIKHMIVANYNAGKSSLCELDARRIEAWSMEPTEELAVQITTQGQDDEYRIATRFKQRFPKLLGSLDRRKHAFWFDESQRTEDSAEWYAKGLLGYVPQLDGLYPLNDFYERCPSFKHLKKTEHYMKERKKFERGKEMNITVSSVSRRLGFEEDLETSDVIRMYELCGYERAWNWRYGKSSPWCAAFSKDELQVMEYWGDLNEYYRTGYGHDLHVKLGCAGITELVDKILAKIKGSETRDALHYFSHDTLLNMMYANLGLFHDHKHLKADNYPEHRDRKWRVSKFSPFASNFAAVLYMCDRSRQGTEGSGYVQYRVEVYLGEKLIELEGCGEARCPLSQFLRRYGAIARECHLDKLCSLKDNDQQTQQPTTAPTDD